MSHYAQLELFTNLLWVLLGIPAWFLWRRERGNPASGRWFQAAGPAVVLGAALVLLFPFVSATDDIHAIGSELEESTSTIRRSVVDGRHGRALTGGNHAFLAHRAHAALHQPSLNVIGMVWVSSPATPHNPVFSQHSGRAPPFLSPALS